MKIDKYCKSWLSQGIGLMFSSRKNIVMEFPVERRISLHMFFVFFPIDVLVLDAQKRIVEIKKDLKPFSFWSSKEKGEYVVEIGREKKEFRLGAKLSLTH